MRKFVNTFFVILAMTSVTYGMILRYSPEADVLSAVPETLSPQHVALPEFNLTDIDDSDIDLGIVTAEPD